MTIAPFYAFTSIIGHVAPSLMYLLLAFEFFLVFVLSYLIGSIPFGYIAGKIKGIDLREHGSHNIGATNAMRVLGKAWGLSVFFCDFMKGFLPFLFLCAISKHTITGIDAINIEDAKIIEMAMILVVMFGTVIGHTFTIFLGFKGGKGVATTAGTLFALSPLIGGFAVLVWILSLLIWRYVSLASMFAGLGMMCAAIYLLIIKDGTCSSADALLLGFFLLISALIIYKHRSNITRIINGTEPKVFTKK